MKAAPIEGSQLAKDIIERLAKLKSSRVNWESLWQEACEYVMPNMSNTFFEGGYSLTQGQKKDQKRFDGTAENALFRFAAAMESILTPRNSVWHGLTTDDPSLNRLPSVKAYFETTQNLLFKHRYSTRANFASQNHEHYLAIGTLGTACMFIDKMQPKGLRYAQIHMAQVYFDEDFQGIIDTCYRPFKLNARQAAQKFGADNLPEQIKKALKDNAEQKFEFIHCIKPRADVEYERKDFKGMAYASYYVSVTGQAVLLEEGFNSFPFAISRYVTAAGELYGRSPAMQALTNIKVLNQQKKTLLKQGHRTVDPVILAHDDGVLDSFSMKPGAINTGAMTSDGKRLIDILPTGNLAVGDKMMQMERDEINAAFMVDLFQIFMDRPQMTATEVLEIAREKGVLFSPTMGRQESEYLGRMIEREIDVLNMQALLPPMPPELVEAGGEYKITYDSPLARAQKAEQASGIMRTIGWASEIAAQAQDPSPLDHFKWDVIIPMLAEAQAVPASAMRSPDEVKAIGDARQQQAATQQVIDAGPTIAALAKTNK